MTEETEITVQETDELKKITFRFKYEYREDVKTSGVGALVGLVLGGLAGLIGGPLGVIVGGLLGAILGDAVEREAIKQERRVRKETTH